MRIDPKALRSALIALLLISSIGFGVGLASGVVYGLADSIDRGHPGYVPLTAVLFCGLGLSAGLIAGLLTGVAIGLFPRRAPRWSRYVVLAVIAVAASSLWQVVHFQRGPLIEPALTAALVIATFVLIVLVARVVKFVGPGSRSSEM